MTWTESIRLARCDAVGACRPFTNSIRSIQRIHSIEDAAHFSRCDAVGAYTRYLDIYLHACQASACLCGFGHVQTGKEI
jgi:hypothetical protein